MRVFGKLSGVAIFGAALALAATSWAQEWDPKPNRDIDAGGDKTLVPIVFVHGNSACGESWERMAMHFHSNGYPATWLNTFDYSTAGGGGGARGGARGGAAAGGAAAEGAARGARGALGARGARGARGGATEGAAAEGAAQAPARGARGGGNSAVTVALDNFIDEVLKRTGHAKVNLVGHSQGTGVSAGYLADAKRAAKVAHYSAVGGGAPGEPNGVPYLVVSGLGDFGRGPSADASKGGKVAWMPAWQDHTMMSTSDEAFWEIYTFFNDKKPKTFHITPEKEPLVGGFLKTYINNQPITDGKVEVWEVAKETGKRIKDKPLATFNTNPDGSWGPFRANPNQYYEFALFDKNLIKSPRHMYREPFKHTDRWVYFRLASNAEGYTASPVDIAPKYLTDDATIVVVRNLYSAMLPGIVNVKVDGVEVMEPIIQPGRGAAQPTAVAIYLADGNQNGKSEIAPITDPAFRRQFVTSCDMYIKADPNKSIKIEMNGRVLNVPAWKSSEAGMVNVMFDDFR